MNSDTAFKDRVQFLVKSVKNLPVNAALAPSSSAAVTKMLEGIDFSKLGTIIELGPGTGPYTAEIIRRAPQDCKIILVEIDPDYATLLKTNSAIGP